MKPEYIPNALSVVRILLVVPVVAWLLDGHYLLAMLAFALAGFTDGLDGFLARRFGWHSPLGGVLDPLADKLLMVSVFVCLVAVDLIPAWLGVVVIGRDALILAGVGLYRWLVGPFAGMATPVSKANTAAQLLFVVAVLAHAALGLPGTQVVIALGAVLFATAVVSGLDYVRYGVGRAIGARREMAVDR